MPNMRYLNPQQKELIMAERDRLRDERNARNAAIAAELRKKAPIRLKTKSELRSVGNTIQIRPVKRWY